MIVSELKLRCHDKVLKDRSVGVVTFNVSQQNLIDDLLAEACNEDAELAHWAYESTEPVFIKNLENVQGDERDVILFSIGYGRDESGRVYMNFGPLNREGGWRRLNVAVSRARREMIVFSSLSPDQINLKQTSSKGVEALKKFLEYASGKEMIPDENVIISRNKLNEDGIVNDICKHLSDKGYICDKLIGHSAFQVDIGIIDKADPSKYILGILLDGANYKDAHTTHDRELGQIDVLNGLGWKIIRIWSMDWWENKNKEVNNILKVLSKIEDEKKETNIDDETEESDNTPSAIYLRTPRSEEGVITNTKIASSYDAENRLEKFTSNDKYNTPVEDAYTSDMLSEAVNNIQKEYQEVELYGVITSTEQFLNPSNIVQTKRLVQKVIDAEAPICDTLLMRRVLQSIGIERTGSRLQKHFDMVYSQLGLKVTINGGRRTLWKPDGIPNDYKQFRVITDRSGKRDAKEVPIEEAANALCYILYEEIALGETDLRKEAARTMGFNRMGKNVVELFDEAIKYSLKNKRIEYGNMENLKLTNAWMEEIKNYLS